MKIYVKNNINGAWGAMWQSNMDIHSIPVTPLGLTSGTPPEVHLPSHRGGAVPGSLGWLRLESGPCGSRTFPPPRGVLLDSSGILFHNAKFLETIYTECFLKKNKTKPR